MKRFIVAFKVAALIAAFFSVNNATAQAAKSGKILIVHLSRTNKTMTAAETEWPAEYVNR